MSFHPTIFVQTSNRADEREGRWSRADVIDIAWNCMPPHEIGDRRDRATWNRLHAIAFVAEPVPR
ncbi:hypothetical protein UNPF46_07840 [Bradyrhizobium sp. UNPF46]|nr:hypothetical protein UNPF46_07840 [Bradyrhizobium sp. UNPF46]